MAVKDDFLGGVVEGFYGQPWTHAQRTTLFQQMEAWGLNTYFYSPKDDLHHRADWRRLYDAESLEQMRVLVAMCQRSKLRFIYGLSPGLDIRFAEPAELDRIRDRLAQMMSIGVQDFALLFDDLPGEMSNADQNQFRSVAEAQASVTNSTYEWLTSLIPNCRMLFCPTPYCDRMVQWELGGADYLDELGRHLHDDVDILWTGPEIISEDIDVASLQQLESRIQRQPVIWDNQHANDYDMRRLFCGPYDRCLDMRQHVRGILSNPNNEFTINFIGIRTLAEYIQRDDYEPRDAFLRNALCRCRIRW